MNLYMCVTHTRHDAARDAALCILMATEWKAFVNVAVKVSQMNRKTPTDYHRLAQTHDLHWLGPETPNVRTAQRAISGRRCITMFGKGAAARCVQGAEEMMNEE